MTSPLKQNSWDPALIEKRWRNSLEKGRHAIDQLGKSLTGTSPGFYVLCLAEVDAVASFNWAKCFVSRAAFITELRRLIAEPTTPSRPVPSLQAYRESQKWFLEMEIKQCEANT